MSDSESSSRSQEELKTLDDKSRLVQIGTANYFEEYGVDIKSSYFMQVKVEPSTHPLVKDPTREVVYSYTPKPEEADADGYLSFGVFVKIVDDATSLAVLGYRKYFQANVSLSLDFKQFKKMQIGKRLSILTKLQLTGEVYFVLFFETFDDDNQLLNQGTHSKVYLDATQKL
jgi:acyl-CoA thioesterase FadM